MHDTLEGTEHLSLPFDSPHHSNFKWNYGQRENLFFFFFGSSSRLIFILNCRLTQNRQESGTLPEPITGVINENTWSQGLELIQTPKSYTEQRRKR